MWLIAGLLCSEINVLQSKLAEAGDFNNALAAKQTSVPLPCTGDCTHAMLCSEVDALKKELDDMRIQKPAEAKLRAQIAELKFAQQRQRVL